MKRLGFDRRNLRVAPAKFEKACEEDCKTAKANSMRFFGEPHGHRRGALPSTMKLVAVVN